MKKHAISSFKGWVWCVFLLICVSVFLFHAVGMASPCHID